MSKNADILNKKLQELSAALSEQARLVAAISEREANLRSRLRAMKKLFFDDYELHAPECECLECKSYRNPQGKKPDCMCGVWYKMGRVAYEAKP